VDQQTFNTIIAGAVLFVFAVEVVMLILVYIAIKKLTGIATTLQTKVEPIIAKAEPIIAKVEPVIDQVQVTIATVKTTVEKISTQAKDTFEKVTVETRAIAAAVSASSQEITNLALHQAEQISATLDYTTSTLQRKVVELDGLLTRTQDRIEGTTLEVQTTVLQPMREVSALLVGLRRTIETLFGRDRKQINQAYQDEEMFIG
jgi:F0F1-type ATP synthase membrane subunit b/b'